MAWACFRNELFVSETNSTAALFCQKTVCFYHVYWVFILLGFYQNLVKFEIIAENNTVSYFWLNGETWY